MTKRLLYDQLLEQWHASKTIIMAKTKNSNWCKCSLVHLIALSLGKEKIARYEMVEHFTIQKYA